MTRGTLIACVGAVVVACSGQFRFDDSTARAVDASAAEASGEGGGDSPGRCARDDDCARFGLRCDQTAGACVACAQDLHCSAPTPRCDTALHHCVECGANADCGDAGRCEPRTRRCLATCSATSPSCPPGFQCNVDEAQCQRCEHDDFCRDNEPRARYCDPELYVCVECTEDGECGAASPVCDRARGRCVECIRLEHCPTERPVCGPTGECLAP